jgi:hypothetical protein
MSKNGHRSDRDHDRGNQRIEDQPVEEQATLTTASPGNGMARVETAMLRAVVAKMDSPTTSSLYDIEAGNVVSELADQGIAVSDQRARQFMRELETFTELVTIEDAPPRNSDHDESDVLPSAAADATIPSRPKASSLSGRVCESPPIIDVLITYGETSDSVPREIWAEYLQQYVTLADRVYDVGQHGPAHYRFGFDPRVEPEESSDIVPSDETAAKIVGDGSRGELNKAVLWLYGAVIDDADVALAARRTLSNYRRRLTNWAVAFPGLLDMSAGDRDDAGALGDFTGYSTWTSAHESLMVLTPLVQAILSDDAAVETCVTAILVESDPRIDPADADNDTRPIDAEIYADLIDRVGTDRLDELHSLDGSSWDDRKRAVDGFIHF